MCKYLKANRVLNKVCWIFLPWQIQLHDSLEYCTWMWEHRKSTTLAHPFLSSAALSCPEGPGVTVQPASPNVAHKPVPLSHQTLLLPWVWGYPQATRVFLFRTDLQRGVSWPRNKPTSPGINLQALKVGAPRNPYNSRRHSFWLPSHFVSWEGVHLEKAREYPGLPRWCEW